MRVAAGGSAVGAVVLGGQAADEARGAVAALRATPHRQLALHGVQVVRGAEPFDGEDLLAVERGGRHEAGVDRRPLGRCFAAIGRGACDEHSAGPALTLGAALLGTGQALGAEPVEGVRRRGDPPESQREPVDRGGRHT